MLAQVLPVGWSIGVSVGRDKDTALIRRARDAETAHLEAVLKVNGAAFLRLQHLAADIRARADLAGRDIELRADDGMQPALWLDLSHRITMEPDPKTYRLSVHGLNSITVLGETADADDMGAQALAVLAHGNVLAARQLPEAGPVRRAATLVYIWLTGVVTGASVLALVWIYMKWLVF